MRCRARRRPASDVAAIRTRGSPRELATDDQALNVAARERPRRQLDLSSDADLLEHAPRARSETAPIEQAHAGAASGGGGCGGEVLPQRCFAIDAVVHAIGRDVRDAALAAGEHRARVDRRAVRPRPSRRRPCAARGSPRRALLRPLPSTPAIPMISAARRSTSMPRSARSPWPVAAVRSPAARRRSCPDLPASRGSAVRRPRRPSSARARADRSCARATRPDDSPPRSTVTSSEIWRTSSSLCVIRRIVRPSAASERSTSNSRRPRRLSAPSSARRTPAPPNRARAP